MSALRNASPRWGHWFDRLAAEMDGEGRNPTLGALLEGRRNRNILGQIADSSDRPPWADDPKVRPAVLAACREADKTDAAPDFKGYPRRDVLGVLEKLLDDSDPELRKLAARMAIRTLRMQDEDMNLANWPIQYIFTGLCKRRAELGPELITETTGDWKSGFWKSCALYVAGRESGEALAESPLLERESESDGRAFEHMVYAMFTETKDSALERACLKRLGEPKWLAGEIVRYAMSIDSAALGEALRKRHRWLTDKDAKKSDGIDMLLNHEAMDIEEWLYSSQLETLGLWDIVRSYRSQQHEAIGVPRPSCRVVRWCSPPGLNKESAPWNNPAGL